MTSADYLLWGTVAVTMPFVFALLVLATGSPKSMEAPMLFLWRRTKHALLHTLGMWVTLAMLLLSMHTYVCAVSSEQCFDRSGVAASLGMFAVPCVVTLYQMVVPSKEDLDLKRDCLIGAIIGGIPFGLFMTAAICAKLFR